MTRGAEQNYQCDECNRADLVCPKCNKTVKQGTPFSKWLRSIGGRFSAHNEFSSYHLVAQNLDFICYWYRQGWFITIEEKRYGATSNQNQRDTHGVVSQMLTIASGATVATLNAKRRKKATKESIEYRGHFVVSFQNTTPDNSEWVKINNKRYIDVKNVVLSLLHCGSAKG